MDTNDKQVDSYLQETIPNLIVVAESIELVEAIILDSWDKILDSLDS